MVSFLTTTRNCKFETYFSLSSSNLRSTEYELYDDKWTGHSNPIAEAEKTPMGAVM